MNNIDGVILFVDDKVHHCSVEDGDLKRSRENELFESLRKDYPVLGVDNLELAERAIRSIGSFSAIILDWAFDDKDQLVAGADAEEVKFVRAPDDRTLRFLEDNEFYSLVYVYSTEDVEELFGPRLTRKFGKRIRFQKKPLEQPAEEIINTIKEWSEENQNLSIPLAWTATINQAIQKVFYELASADPNWLRDLAESAKEDCVNEDLFIIEILQFLLTENLIQNAGLRTTITSYLESLEQANAVTNEESIAKLFNRLFYTRLVDDATIMTGDICQISDDKFGIIISPECDIRRITAKETNSFELLVFQKDDFKKHIARTRAKLDDQTEQNFKRERYGAWDHGNASQKEKLEELRKLFNQNEPRFHILPSFPMLQSLNQSVVIEFSLGLELHTSGQVKGYKREYKLNSLFLQQLRQRYLAYLGRIGVPGLPTTLRNFNLK
jgi:hypothetical protein